MRNQYRLGVLVFALASWAASPAGAALVTFSAFNNGFNTATDPETTSTGTAFPANYQPLLNAYPAPGGNTDGGNLGVTITYSNFFGANTASNNAVNEHTHMVTASDTALENAYDNGNGTMTLTFDKAVTLPSFYYSFFSGSAGATPTFSGFTNAGDATPIVTSSPTYPGGGYVWQQVTAFGNTPLRQITFSKNTGNYLQLDDLTLNTPEPASVGLFGIAGVLALSRRRPPLF